MFIIALFGGGVNVGIKYEIYMKKYKFVYIALIEKTKKLVYIVYINHKIINFYEKNHHEYHGEI